MHTSNIVNISDFVCSVKEPKHQDYAFLYDEMMSSLHEAYLAGLERKDFGTFLVHSKQQVTKHIVDAGNLFEEKPQT